MVLCTQQSNRSRQLAITWPAPPTMAVASPRRVCSLEPEIGASRYCTPRAASRAPSRAICSGSPVVVSIRTCPGRSPSLSRSSTASTVSVVYKLISTRSQTVSGLSAQRAPRATSGSAFSLVRLWTHTVYPASSSRSVSAVPIRPSPIMPTLVVSMAIPAR